MPLAGYQCPFKHFLIDGCVRPTANLELASLPTTTPENRKNLLSFVVCGGGPTGVEFAAELADMMSEDVLSYVSSKLLESFQDDVVLSH